MKRYAFEQLKAWKENPNRKPLVIRGARQVGKTWLLKEFGKQAYSDTVYINFDSNTRMADLFAVDLDTDRLILGLELYAGRKLIRTILYLFLMKFRKCRKHLLLLNIFMRMLHSIILYALVLF